jgi:type VI protein secretion system component VasF
MQPQQFDQILKNQRPLAIIKTEETSEISMTKAALPIISLITKVQSNTIKHNIKSNFIHSLAKYESILHNQKQTTDKIYKSRIFICAWLDAAIEQSSSDTNIILGSGSISQAIQLNHNIQITAWHIVEQTLLSPEENRDLLEVIFICLNMGYDKLFPTSCDKASIKNEIYQNIRQFEKQESSRPAYINETTKKNNIFNMLFIISILILTYYIITYA